MNQPYLKKATLAEAQARWFGALERAGWFAPKTEVVPVRQAVGRVTAKDVLARRAVPHLRAAAMDGIALRAEATAGARIDRPLALKAGRDYVRVDTGDPLSDEADAVVKLEDLDFPEANTCELRKATFPGQYVRPVGEDFPEGGTVLGAHRLVAPEAVAACLAAGVFELEVLVLPKVLIIPTGSELGDPQNLSPNAYPETNGALFEGYLRRWQAVPTLHPLLPDDEGAIREAVEAGLESHDAVLVGAGTSKGREDFTTRVLARFGEVLVHGVSMHPGHPVVLGVASGKPVMGVPGYPVATWVTLDQFVLPLLERFYSCPLQPRHTVRGTLAKTVHASLGEVEFVRVRLEHTDQGLRIHPLAGKASALSSLIRADGILEVPSELGGIAAGETVEVRLFWP